MRGSIILCFVLSILRRMSGAWQTRLRCSSACGNPVSGLEIWVEVNQWTASEKSRLHHLYPFSAFWNSLPLASLGTRASLPCVNCQAWKWSHCVYIYIYRLTEPQLLYRTSWQIIRLSKASCCSQNVQTLYLRPLVAAEHPGELDT